VFEAGPVDASADVRVIDIGPRLAVPPSAVVHSVTLFSLTVAALVCLLGGKAFHLDPNAAKTCSSSIAHKVELAPRIGEALQYFFNQWF
jgi:hypothetical protein